MITLIYIALATAALASCGAILRDETDPTPAPGTPPEPTGLEVSGDVTRVLTWDSVEGAVAYDVRYSMRDYAFADPNKWDPWVTVEEATSGTTYRLMAMGRHERRFAVRARNERGPGA